ncbi:MAG: hypothetical protein J6C42_06890, partial [Clostridia bacterium]|nr:hypothetical protein [Clostridia bacterium]
RDIVPEKQVFNGFHGVPPKMCFFFIISQIFESGSNGNICVTQQFCSMEKRHPRTQRCHSEDLSLTITTEVLVRGIFALSCVSRKKYPWLS